MPFWRPHFLDAATRPIPPSESGAEIRRISRSSSKVLDDVTGVAAAFLEEQSAWAAQVNRGTRRAARYSPQCD
ncbi:hypothetical protein [Rhodococcus sp. 14C212]|uniref:hypothetical protein n=1 Tax=Rhodococcus sp. 14C212 TaxID=2711209 RepID=UPI001F0F14A2|nr:hypothetical protein [Rhodococcus sp. 14C212]